MSEKQPSDLTQYWLRQLKQEERAHQKWREQARKVEDVYYQDKDQKTKYPILWSNVQILHSALYSRTAQPDVRRRNTDLGGGHKPIAVAVERAISYQVDTQRFDSNVDRAVDDYLCAGLGQVRVRYEVDGEAEITNQRVTIESYSWKHFHWEPAKSWEQVDWVAFDHYKTAKEIKKEFNITVEGSDLKEGAKTSKGEMLVHEIYCRRSKKIYVITKHHGEPLDVREDKLGLNGFFPCPKPLMANVKTDRLVPAPDYKYYQNQANRLNQLENRIDAITKGIKDVGFYEASLSELGNLERAPDGSLVPIDRLMDRLEGRTDFQNVVATLPIDHKVGIVAQLRQEQEALKSEIYDITGIADIVRGSTMASETATAQQIKGQWANVRLTRKQNDVNRFIREIFRIMAEIVSEHFIPEMLAAQTGVELDEQQINTLRQDSLRGFAIDVETDSTVAVDEQAEQEQRLSMLSTVTDYITNILPAIQQGMIPVNLGVELLLTAVRSFKYGRNLEEMVAAIGEERSPEKQMQMLQQQLQEMQGQAEQVQQEAGMAVQQRDQEIARLNGELQKFDEREQARKDSEAIASNNLKGAQAEKAKAEAMETVAEATAEAGHALQ